MENMELTREYWKRKREILTRQQLSLGGDFASVAEVFQLLDDGNRVKIFWLLCHSEGCVQELAELTQMSSPALSHHLKLLREAGLVTARREGKEVFYRAAETPACRLLHNVIEKVMEIACPETGSEEMEPSSVTPEQVETVRRMHDDLLAHPETRVTIEELAHRYLMNPTTLKEVFKQVYGESLAAHMKEHRLEKAAELLVRSDESIARIAAAVGYDSSSRFSAAFRERYHLLPREYRKQLKNNM